MPVNVKYHVRQIYFWRNIISVFGEEQSCTLWTWARTFRWYVLPPSSRLWLNDSKFQKTPISLRTSNINKENLFLGYYKLIIIFSRTLVLWKFSYRNHRISAAFLTSHSTSLILLFSNKDSYNSVLINPNTYSTI